MSNDGVKELAVEQLVRCSAAMLELMTALAKDAITVDQAMFKLGELGVVMQETADGYLSVS